MRAGNVQLLRHASGGMQNGSAEMVEVARRWAPCHAWPTVWRRGWSTETACLKKVDGKISLPHLGAAESRLSGIGQTLERIVSVVYAAGLSRAW